MGFGSNQTRGIKNEKNAFEIMHLCITPIGIIRKTVQFWFPKFKKNVETLQNVHEHDTRLILLLTDNKFWISKTWRTVQIIPSLGKLVPEEQSAAQLLPEPQCSL